MLVNVLHAIPHKYLQNGQLKCAKLKLEKKKSYGQKIKIKISVFETKEKMCFSFSECTTANWKCRNNKWPK